MFDNIFESYCEVLIRNLLSDILLFQQLHYFLICISLDLKQFLIEYEIDICLFVVGTLLYRIH